MKKFFHKLNCRYRWIYCSFHKNSKISSIQISAFFYSKGILVDSTLDYPPIALVSFIELEYLDFFSYGQLFMQFHRNFSIEPNLMEKGFVSMMTMTMT